MAYIPSDRVSVALEAATVGISVDRISDGRAVLACKLPETTIKAIRLGASTSFLVAVARVDKLEILLLGMAVQDEPEHPLRIQAPTLSPENLTLLAEVLLSGSTTLHCLNELNHPTLSGWCQLERIHSLEAAENLAHCSPWLLTRESSREIDAKRLSAALEAAMNAFQHEIFRDLTEPRAESIVFSVSIPLTLTFWNQTQTVAVTEASESEPFAIGDVDEGRKLERLGLVALSAVYRSNAHHSPQLQQGANRRELIDLLGYDDDWICVVESKAMSMLNGEASKQTSDRRKSKVSKDIRKGLSQLSGALKQIRSGAELRRHGGEALAISNRAAPAHAIVLLSEMYAFVDWRGVAADLSEASNPEEGLFFHVLDLRELAELAQTCPDATLFSIRLFQRWDQVKTKGTAYGRIRLPGELGRG